MINANTPPGASGTVKLAQPQAAAKPAAAKVCLRALVTLLWDEADFLSEG